MRMNGLPLMAFNGAVFARAATRAVSFWGKFDRFAKATVLSPWHERNLARRPSKVAVAKRWSHRFLNQGMSFTDFGTLMLEPFRSLSFEVFRLVPADLVFSTTFSATFWPFPTAFSVASLVEEVAFFDADLAFVAAFLEADFAFDAAFFAAPAAFPVAFFAVSLVAVAAFAAAETFFATAAESPAFCKSPTLAFANLATVPNFAAVSFFAVAAPTPGNDVMPEPLAFPAMVSPDLPWNGPILNLPARIDGAEMRFLHQCLACPQVNVGSAVDEVVNATHSVLMAQVRHADASHKIDTAHQLLRGKHYSGPSRVVYLGDVAKAILAQLAHPDTPVFTQAPGYNEQRWTLVTNSGDLRVEIQSLPYWGWGLVTSGYLNVIRLGGPLAERARLVLDTCSALGQSPWEMAHLRGAERWAGRHLKTNLKENERHWRALFETGKNDLNEFIESMRTRAMEAWSETIDEADEWRAIIDDDLHMARQALAEDNAPGVERAIARLEATLIQMVANPDADYIPAPSTRFSDGGDIVGKNDERAGEMLEMKASLFAEEEVPFVDLTNDAPLDEEE